MRESGNISVSLALLLLLGCPATLPSRPRPIADAGPDQIVRVAEAVRVGTRLEGGLRAEWKMVSATGRYVFLDPTNAAQPQILFHDPGTYVLSLVVTDGARRSDPDYVSVRVEGCLEGETLPCYGGPPGTVGVGACRAGLRTCLADGRYGACVGAVLPGPETCGDSVDSDCDGLGDEADPDCADACPDPPQQQDTCGLGACRRTMTRLCSGGVWTPCTPAPPTEAQGADLCDGVDGDCDGATDEDAPKKTWYPDLDGDGAGGRGGAVESCRKPDGSWSPRADDCDDTDPAVHPGTACDDGQACTMADWCGPSGECAGIPEGCATCATSCTGCGRGGCCEADCAGGDCGTCPGGCACNVTCTSACSVSCARGARCGASVANVSGDSSLSCTSGAVCDLLCDTVDGDCRLNCESGSDCSLSCSALDACTLTCAAGGRCRIYCGNDLSSCTLSCSGGDAVDCPTAGWRACSLDQCP